MPAVGIDKLINKTVYVKAGANVTGYASDLKTEKKIFKGGALIGNIFSWVTDKNGNLFLMFYLTPADYNNFIATYVKADTSKLSIPALPKILAELEAESEKNKREEKGIIQYNIDKYLPYIIGAVVVAVALPTVLNSTKKIGAMKKNNNTLLLAGAAAVGVYLLTRKKKIKAGKPIIDEGSGQIVNNSLPDIADDNGSIFSNASANETSSFSVPGPCSNIRYIGPFQVEYERAGIMAGKTKGDLGSIKTC